MPYSKIKAERDGEEEMTAVKKCLRRVNIRKRKILFKFMGNFDRRLSGYIYIGYIFQLKLEKYF